MAGEARWLRIIWLDKLLSVLLELIIISLSLLALCCRVFAARKLLLLLLCPNNARVALPAAGQRDGEEQTLKIPRWAKLPCRSPRIPARWNHLSDTQSSATHDFQSARRNDRARDAELDGVMERMQSCKDCILSITPSRNQSLPCRPEKSVLSACRGSRYPFLALFPTCSGRALLMPRYTSPADSAADAADAGGISARGCLGFLLFWPCIKERQTGATRRRHSQCQHVPLFCFGQSAVPDEIKLGIHCLQDYKYPP